MALTEPLAARAEVSADAVLRLRRPLEIAVSPDGSQVATTVSASFARKGERAETAIWIAPTGRDGQARQLTRGPGQDMLPRWSPSGRDLAFASDRGHPGRMSLHVLRAEPGEAEPL